VSFEDYVWIECPNGDDGCQDSIWATTPERAKELWNENEQPNARPEWRGAKGDEMQTGPAIPRPLQAARYAIRFGRSQNQHINRPPLRERTEPPRSWANPPSYSWWWRE
jgi:hypothetical protein